MRHASKILYIFLFGLPAAVIPASLQLTDNTGLAGALAGLFFCAALGLWAAVRRKESAEVSRSILGVALGVAWGMAAVMGWQSFASHSAHEHPHEHSLPAHAHHKKDIR